VLRMPLPSGGVTGQAKTYKDCRLCAPRILYRAKLPLAYQLTDSGKKRFPMDPIADYADGVERDPGTEKFFAPSHKLLGIPIALPEGFSLAQAEEIFEIRFQDGNEIESVWEGHTSGSIGHGCTIRYSLAGCWLLCNRNAKVTTHLSIG
jgi:hypothetical protein